MATTTIVPNKRTVFESVRTIIGNENQIRRELGLPYSITPNSTLNEYLKINQNVSPPSTTIPTIGYYCIGYGGISMQNCTNNQDVLPFPKVFQHRADDTGLFKMVPFVMREINNDLTPQERAKYALRREENFKGVKYYAYYLKRLDLSRTQISTQIITKQADGSFTNTEYTPRDSNLKPQPQELTVGEENVLKATYARSVAQVPVNFGKQDVEEIYNVFNILHGDPMTAVISEIGLVSGIDKTVEVVISSGRSQFTEVIAAQIAHINRTIQYLGANTGGFESIFNLGINEPIWNISQNQ